MRRLRFKVDLRRNSYFLRCFVIETAFLGILRGNSYFKVDLRRYSYFWIVLKRKSSFDVALGRKLHFQASLRPGLSVT